MLNLDYIRIIGDPVLKTECDLVTEFDGALQNTIKRLSSFLKNNDLGIGLAANQLGINKKIFVYDFERRNKDDAGEIINPTIVQSDGIVTYEEGCLSIPEIYMPIERPEFITVIGFDSDGNELELELDGINARLFQHEIDHLNGLTMLDRLDEDLKDQYITEVNEVVNRIKNK